MSDAPKFVENRTLYSTTDGLKSVEETFFDSIREAVALHEMKSKEVLALVILFHFDYLGTDGILKGSNSLCNLSFTHVA